ncbi:MAG TPA: LppP/LprE family lipoprotein, partial [Solirubrobacteraceae bacterium]
RGMLSLGVALAALLGGCGGATKTVTVSSAPPSVQSTTPAKTTTSGTTPTTATRTSEAPGASGGTSGPVRTRTAPEPAFTRQPSTAEGLSGAEAVLQAQGFTARSTSDYHPGQTLRVLVGTRTGSGERAFFFVAGHYIGTDAKEPSAQIRVVSQSDTEVTLAYSLSGGSHEANVRFQLNNGKLTPLDPIPSARSRQ